MTEWSRRLVGIKGRKPTFKMKEPKPPFRICGQVHQHVEQDGRIMIVHLAVNEDGKIDHSILNF